MIYIHQIFYDHLSFDLLDDGFIPLDNTENSDPDWYEFKIIYNFLKNTTLIDNSWYGFLSPSFKLKTNLSSEEVKSFIVNNKNADVCLASSCYDQIALHKNCFIQGEKKHPGLIKATEYILHKQNIALELRNIYGHSLNTAYSNYVIAKKQYWDIWLAIAETFLDMMSQDVTYSQKANKLGTYKNTTAKLGVFIQERIPAIILSSNIFNVVSLLNPNYEPCNKNIEANNYILKGLLQSCDHCKQQYSITGDKEFIRMFDFLIVEIDKLIAAKKFANKK